MSNKKKDFPIKKFHNENGVIKIDFKNYLPESAISSTRHLPLDIRSG